MNEKGKAHANAESPDCHSSFALDETKKQSIFRKKQQKMKLAKKRTCDSVHFTFLLVLLLFLAFLLLLLLVFLPAVFLFLGSLVFSN